MSSDAPGQELLIQLETALHRLVESFWEEPYRFFTESDAVAALQFWVARRPGLAQTQRTADGFETSLLHREYPPSFASRRVTLPGAEAGLQGVDIMIWFSSILPISGIMKQRLSLTAISGIMGTSPPHRC